MAAPRIIAASVLTVALTGCGSQVIDGLNEESTPVAPTTTTSIARTTTTTPGSTTTVTTQGQDTTTTTVEGIEPVQPDVAILLDEIDVLLAQLDHLSTDAAASLAAEEGEFIP